MIHKKTSKSAFVADLLVKIMKYLYGRDVDTLSKDLVCGRDSKNRTHTIRGFGGLTHLHIK